MPLWSLSLENQLELAHTHDTVTGIATVGTSTYHGLGVNSKVRVAISTVGVRTDGDSTIPLARERGAFTGSFTVVKNTGDLKFEMNIGMVLQPQHH